jgi:hypothetical protein
MSSDTLKENVSKKTNETNELNESNETNRNEVFKVIQEFIPDLLNTFPEYKNNLHKGIVDILDNSFETNEAQNVFEHCKSVYAERFFDILYQNDDIFINNEINTEFLPNIEFKDLWKQDITTNTKSVIWKYLQLLLLSVITCINDHSSFGDTAKLFEAINEEEFKNKIEETISNMQSVFENKKNNNDLSNIDLNNLPNPEDVQNHINGMLDGKLGSLAKEIAEETANELNIDMEDATNINDVFKKMFKNPGKLMSIVKNIGNKLETKLKSGDLNESELMKEASEMMTKMKDMPGMQNINNMLSQFGLPTGKNSKINMNAFQNHMKNNIRVSQQKEQMLQRLQERKKQRETFTNSNNNIKQKSENEFVFTTGEKVEKSLKTDKNKINKLKKKKKGKK